MPSKLIVSALAALFLFSMLIQGSSRARASEISCAITWNELRDDEKPKNFAGYFDETFGHYDAPTLPEDEPSYDSLWFSGRRPKPTTCVRILIKGEIETGELLRITSCPLVGQGDFLVFLHPFVDFNPSPVEVAPRNTACGKL